MVKNPGLIGQTTSASASTPAPAPTQTPTLDVTVTTPAMSQPPAPTYSITEGKCAGMGENYCKNLVMPDYSIVPNPNWVPGKVQTQAQVQTVDRGDDDNDDIQYCVGQAAPAYPDSCYDRNDLPDNDDEIDNDNDGLDDREGNDEIGEDLPQEGGCQGDDNFCDADEGCRSESVDCIDDREFDEDDYNG